MLSDVNDVRAKGLEYAAEPERYMQLLGGGRVKFLGHNSVHNVVRQGDVLTCNCETFLWLRTPYGIPFCSHTVAVEKAYPSYGLQNIVALPCIENSAADHNEQ